ncbi:MAG TPA: Hpt domain-containing protein [Burkholderiaceae bacterium]|nr:Hpt domain-containing protein [Burkholderiaceae bacterium]
MAAAGVRATIAANFDGDPALYRAFSAACAVQFARDAVAGRAGCDAGDLPAVRRLAHNLKSALLMLGHDELSAMAANIETLAAAGDLVRTRTSWHLLDAALRPLRTP